MFLLQLFQKNKVFGEVVDLEVSSRMPFDSVTYRIVRHSDGEIVGECDLRFGDNEELYYAGNFGYRVFEPFRGNGYAYYASMLMMAIARDKYHMEKLYVTCSPENIPSLRTIERLGATLVEPNARVPRYHWLYRRKEYIKNIYILNL